MFYLLADFEKEGQFYQKKQLELNNFNTILTLFENDLKSVPWVQCLLILHFFVRFILLNAIFNSF